MAAIDENKSLGQVLSDLPIETLLTGMGTAIAKTQAALDKNSIDGLQRLAEAKLKLRERDGKEVEKSLIELGFAPAFYFFSEATLDLVMTISIHLTESSSDSVGLVVGVIQAATSVNEQTLTFVPKLAVIALVLVVFGASMLGLIGDFTEQIFEQIAQVSR